MTEYLVISHDMGRPILQVMNDDGLRRLLRELSEASEVSRGTWEPKFLNEVPARSGYLDIHDWDEAGMLVLKVQVVVPRPVTTKWELP